MDKDFLRNNDLGLLLLRLMVGGLMLFHGVHKLIYGVAGIEGMLAGIGLPGFLAYFSLAAELAASILIVLGAWTRVAAVVMAGNMVVAILMAHLPVIFSVDPATGGWAIELPMLYLLGAAVLCLTGGGKYALTKGHVTD
ncbi:MAG: DoxX family protein [Prevotellaceae bacterium]|jgi:putative oxidoreductase|nr:DoxX family protein [Prevotellaceae bacterium]MDY3855624.1 DoxX family protein [Bacteroidaceae bacterium]